jgi:hypothetical protein
LLPLSSWGWPSRRSTGSLGKLELATLGLTGSRDGRTILYSKIENQGSDLMMVENFR